MASRRQAVVAQAQRPGGGVPRGKQKNANAADRKGCREALGDIANLVNLRLEQGKQELKINRPITRSYGAQLLAKAQAAAAANKKPADIAAVAPVVRAGKVPAKKVTTKIREKKKTVAIPRKKQEPKQTSVASGSCGKSSRKNEEPKQTSVASGSCGKSSRKNEEPKQTSVASGSRGKSSRKKVSTFTSVLSARSKVACGFMNKPKELVANIDAADSEDQLAVVEYVEDIYMFYKSAENSSNNHGYMEAQVQINEHMRAILADWLIEVHHKFHLMPETLYLTFYILDRYLSMETVLRKELQLVGMSAMLIASKYEEMWAPEVNYFMCIADGCYTREQILGMEKRILNKLEWNFTVPTPFMFLNRFIKAALSDTEMKHMVFFFAELALMQYSMLMYTPSMVAASAVYAARCTLNKNPRWTKTLNCHTGYSDQQLMESTKILVQCHAAASESKLKTVYEKYSSERFGAVALHPPATKLLGEMEASKSRK